MTVHERIRRVLAAMSQVSEADGQSVVMFDPNTHHDCSIPSGVRASASVATLDVHQPRSLFDEWADRFDELQSADEYTLGVMVTAAETALASYTNRHPGREVDEHDDPTSGTEARCLRDYVGVNPKEAAVIEATAYGGDPNRLAQWLEGVRARNGYHRQTGEELPTGEGRLRLVAQLKAEGKGARVIAQQLSCAVSTAQRLVAQVEGRRAA